MGEWELVLLNPSGCIPEQLLAGSNDKSVPAIFFRGRSPLAEDKTREIVHPDNTRLEEWELTLIVLNQAGCITEQLLAVLSDKSVLTICIRSDRHSSSGCVEVVAIAVMLIEASL
jgi:hypothetical protein